MINSQSNQAVRNQVIALAGLYQCVDLVQQIAWRGQIEDSREYEICLNSLLATEAPSYEDVYGGTINLKLGLQALKSTFKNENDKNSLECMRYAVTLLYLEKKLSKQPKMLEKISQGLDQVQYQLEHFELTHINVISKLADIYQETISKIGPRIIVHGDQNHLANPDNASRIRALLFAAIRASWLWRQAGGSRWQLFFGKKNMLKELDRMLLT